MSKRPHRDVSRKLSPRDGRYRRTTCSFCGKMGWNDRRDARAMIKSMRLHGRSQESAEVVLNAYQCPRTPKGIVALWHIGHTRIEGDQKLNPNGRSWGDP